MVSKVDRELRLAMAKDLLLYTNLKPVEIARRLGFNNDGDFRQYFKRHYHTTPLRWRAGHHLYNPNITEVSTRIQSIQITPVVLPAKDSTPHVKGTAWLVPSRLTVIDTIDAIVINNCIITDADGNVVPLTPEPRTTYRPTLRRIDTSCVTGAYRVAIAVSTRNSTIDVDVASPHPIRQVTLDITLKVSSPTLPDGMTLWSASSTNANQPPVVLCIS